jgi:hypothetical protein
MINVTSQQFESYVPVYDTVPESWEEAKPFLVEVLKKISNAVNIRTIGWLLDEELLSGQAFIPGAVLPGNNPGVFRQVLRKVIDVGPLVATVTKTVAHGVVFDANLTSIDSWLEATNSATFRAATFAYPELVINGPNIEITSPEAFDRAFFFWEYIQEL